ncbi:MAG: phosphate ABC transporter permease PstA [Longibaculum muris]|uniref:Phosphate transport system permease protein PstA n=1 Tax=Longibaculum muris TaxID=1796628 RepID=A0A4R3Z0M3_9FIRM|nr:phosphate ABC transporter permease PstA [Longibaculum muris]KXU42524.1 phosphate ABC transporter, permease protein PstA [Candidatus Stoquefichus sp. KLE1796]MBS5368487.1 phosphate ABC transporter permease PstA [Coprobacillus cateniformis]MCR1887925.1 phosphate ABC transporter permease PstA [Longibaculum muris]MED9812910.1 phosphate ABC transporter permease PstA [Longibaculum muris]TCV98520.1 phosphate transport system permease protein [Longibaculum muris]
MNNSIYEKKSRVIDNVVHVLIQLSTFISVSLLVVIIGYICYRGIPHFSFDYLIQTTSILKNTVGILPNIINTIYIIVVTLVIACPIGIGGAIYLNEYATNKKFVNIISFTTEVLAGIPSIIYGLFGMLFFGGVLKLEYSILTGSLTLAIMILPIISRNAQVALQAVPKSYREAALGMGSTKWYMIRSVLLPSAIPGILTGVILAMGRIVAESAALLFTAGSLSVLPKSLFGHLFSSGGTLTIQLYLEMAKAHYEQAFVIAFILILIILLLNFIAKWISNQFDVNKRG